MQVENFEKKPENYNLKQFFYIYFNGVICHEKLEFQAYA